MLWGLTKIDLNAAFLCLSYQQETILRKIGLAGCVYASRLDSGPNLGDVVLKSARLEGTRRDWSDVWGRYLQSK